MLLGLPPWQWSPVPHDTWCALTDDDSLTAHRRDRIKTGLSVGVLGMVEVRRLAGTNVPTMFENENTVFYSVCLAPRLPTRPGPVHGANWTSSRQLVHVVSGSG